METTDVKKAMPVPSSVRVGEMTTVGLRMSDGHIYEEPKAELRWPQAINTYKSMSYDATIQSAFSAVKAMIRRIKWTVKTEGVDVPSEEQKAREQFIEQCMHDMEHSWSDFVNESLSMMIYGFSVHEKVYKVRQGYEGRHKYPSKFNDQKYGWAKLPIRSQDTIWKWIFDAKGQRLEAVEQDLSLVAAGYGREFEFNETRIPIPYNKILHFRHDTQRGNPEGTSPLRNCYIAWKYKTTIEEFEAIGISRDLAGMPMISLPPDYMSPDASDDKKAVYAWAQDVIRNLHANEQAGLVFPKFIDPETKQDVFDFKLISVDGGKQFDTSKVIDRYENKILMTFLADVLKMGQDASGSFALSDNKTNLLAIGIESILKEFLEVINRDLIPQTGRMNMWDLSQPLPIIGYDDLDERDLDKLGSFIQRAVSVGAMEVDQSLSDSLRDLARVAPADSSKPMREDMLPEAQKKKEASQAGQTTQKGNETGGAATKTNSANAS